VLLRDPAGALWCGEAPTLRRASDAVAREALAALERDGGSLLLEAEQPRPTRRRHRYRNEVIESPAGSRDIGELAARLFARLAPGEFLARVELAPWLDEHGLAVAYDRQLHFVRGRLSPEDCLR
jgi:hypothetical protein